MDRKRIGLKLDAHSKKELLELLKSHVKQDHMPKSLHELLHKWTDGGDEAVSEETDLEEADT
ncbi:hypothetical protein CBW65_14265 [Tumebacillus avium]|uniref:Uncharacterized protein n=1 Tax=Tumebacillus avium TaxID=1903704 RepID=A0A1Y0IND0_9BACL|nr:hypothetical protein [Tumebacillus avium]ARU62041.1 hypothetical protein CBW65_14265 [Tumebacillus avium]